MLNRKKTLIIFSMLFFIVTTAVTYAGKAKSGLKVCGGGHFARLGANELVVSVYCLRNFDSNETINIVSVDIFDGNGNEVLFTELPTNDPNFKDELAPKQGTCFVTRFALEGFLPRSAMPISTYIYWETASGEKAESLGVGGSRVAVDASTDAERSRRPIDCRNLE